MREKDLFYIMKLTSLIIYIVVTRILEEEDKNEKTMVLKGAYIYTYKFYKMHFVLHHIYECWL